MIDNLSKEITTLLNKKDLNNKDLIVLNDNIMELMKCLKTLRNNIVGLEDLCYIAYGIHNNPYSGISQKIEYCISAIDNNLIGYKRITDIIKKSEENPISTDSWMFYRLKEICCDIINCFNKATLAKRNKEEIIRLALRFDEYKHTKFSPCHQFWYIFDPDCLKETKYTVNGWSIFPTVTYRNRNDGDLWNILKELYPEEYI